MKPGARTFSAAVGPHDAILDRLRRRVHDYTIPDGDLKGTRPLRGLTLDSGDPAVALLDAWATMIDVHSFYQERIAAEGYLRTARDPRSIKELVQMLGVAPVSPLSARVDLAFMVSDAPGTPDSVSVPAGTAAQSLPKPGEQPVTFETEHALDARAIWNEMTVARGAPRAPWLSSLARGVIIEGSAAGAGAGDRVLLVGSARGAPWSATKRLRRVGQARRRGLVVLLWDEPLDASLGEVAIDDVAVWLARAPQRLFGAGAPAWDTLPLEEKARHSAVRGGLRRLDDAASEWRPLEDRSRLGGDVTCLAAGPGDVVLAAVSGRGLVRSSDGGATWSTVGGLIGGAPVRCLASDGSRLLAGTTQGGVFRSLDAGITWEQLRGELVIDTLIPRRVRGPLPSTTVRSIAAFIAGSEGSAGAYVLAGTDDGVFLWDETARVWNAVNGGLPLSRAASDPAPVQVRSIAIDHETGAFYLGTDHGVFASRELGGGWAPLVVRVPGEGVAALALDRDGALWVAPDSGGVYATRDGTSWSSVAELDGVPVRALATRTAPGGAFTSFYAATRDRVVRSVDGGSSWQTLPAIDGPLASLAVTPQGAILVGTPIAGVVDGAWPGWALAPGRLELPGATRRPGVGEPIALSQAGRATATWRVRDVSDEATTRFGEPGRALVVTLEPGADPGGFDRDAAEVHLAATRLVVATSQLRRGATLDAGFAALDAHLSDDDVFERVTIEAIDVADVPGDEVAIAAALPETTAGRIVFVTGRRVRATARVGHDSPPIDAEEIYDVLARPTPTSPGVATWRLRGSRGQELEASLPDGTLEIVGASVDGETVIERRRVVGCSVAGAVTRLALDAPLEAAFDPATTRVLGNVVSASHGVTVDDVLGGGTGAADLQFALRRSPLTWTIVDGIPTPAIEVRVNEQLWARVTQRANLGPADAAYVVVTLPTGETVVRFGDGIQGARPPVGHENVTARYRTGAGPLGNVPAGAISLLPHGVAGIASVVNPLAASGGAAEEDPTESAERAPLEVRTLDRVVSIGDFAEFVRTYPGIARAHTRTLWDGHRDVTAITVATTDEGAGHALGPSLESALRAALRRFHFDPGSVVVLGFTPRWFDVRAVLIVAPDFVAARVVAAARTALLDAFSFARRRVAQDVAASEVVRALADVRGVRGAALTSFSVRGRPGDAVPPRLHAEDARWDAASRAFVPAELLLVAPDGITLEIGASP